LFVMSVMSTFEVYIKQSIHNILSAPNPAHITTLPSSRRANQQDVDSAYALFHSYVDVNTGAIVLDASNFYACFDPSFNTTLTTHFNGELQQQLKELTTEITIIEPLLGSCDTYDDVYMLKEGRREHLEKTVFQDAEQAFLLFKLKRNDVAHNFLSGLNDSMEDLCLLYYRALVYVAALLETLKEYTL